MEFEFTEELLNSLLINVTLTPLNTLGLWNTLTNATITCSTNIYVFSRPLNLYLPYGLSFLVALLFIILGSLALYWNGVSAIDGGFLQLVKKTTTSNRLNEAAAGACLGGIKNTSRDLKKLKVRFGEVIEGDGLRIRVRRAGFGVEDEVVTLEKGTRYGFHIS